MKSSIKFVKTVFWLIIGALLIYIVYLVCYKLHWLVSIQGLTMEEAKWKMLSQLGPQIMKLIFIGVGMFAIYGPVAISSGLGHKGSNETETSGKIIPEGPITVETQNDINDVVLTKDINKMSIDEERLKKYFKASFKGLGGNPNHFSELIEELERSKAYMKPIDIGRIAYMIWKSGQMIRQPKSFSAWMEIFFHSLGLECPKETSMNKSLMSTKNCGRLL